MGNTSHGGHADELTPFSDVKTGQVIVPAGGGPAQLPDVPGGLLRFKAAPANADTVSLRGSGDADGWPLPPGAETGFAPVENLNLYELAGAAGDALHYEVLSRS